ncbi:MAG: hypothetical protein HZB76_02970 [Chlamydiae bacterium]|nr:hypothetical protein [Chlamydiota bacterium]
MSVAAIKPIESLEPFNTEFTSELNEEQLLVEQLCQMTLSDGSTAARTLNFSKKAITVYSPKGAKEIVEKEGFQFKKDKATIFL